MIYLAEIQILASLPKSQYTFSEEFLVIIEVLVLIAHALVAFNFFMFIGILTSLFEVDANYERERKQSSYISDQNKQP